jgi:tagaturonate epimerase
VADTRTESELLTESQNRSHRFSDQGVRPADTLKLSVHSGSDKFSLYPIIERQIKNHDAGLHVKTAGTNMAGRRGQSRQALDIASLCGRITPKPASPR